MRISDWSSDVCSSDLLARDLHRIFPEESAQSFYKALTKDASFAYLRRRALPEQVAQVNALGEIAIEFPREKERLYPQRTLGAHVLGFVDRDGHGAMGIERAFDGRLTDDKMRSEPLVLSIDSRVQGALESELYAGMVAHRAKGGTGLVLDANRSEEHTSELQSLMRNSYAVFCLKKKNTPRITTIIHHKSL